MTLFLKRKTIDKNIIDDIVYDLQFQKGRVATISSNGKGSVKREIRSATVKSITPEFYFDYNALIENLCEEFAPEHKSSDLIVKEIQYLKYGISDHFKKHSDVISSKNKRRFSTVTMVSKENDLSGGDLILYDGKGDKYSAGLEVGETIVFYSDTLHEVTPITKGGREVIVSWVYDL